MIRIQLFPSHHKTILPQIDLSVFTSVSAAIPHNYICPVEHPYLQPYSDIRGVHTDMDLCNILHNMCCQLFNLAIIRSKPIQPISASPLPNINRFTVYTMTHTINDWDSSQYHRFILPRALRLRILQNYDQKYNNVKYHLCKTY